MDFRMGKPNLSVKFEPIRQSSDRRVVWSLVVRLSYDEYIVIEKQTRGTETSQYPEERTSTETPLVVASERGPGQWRMRDNRNRLESRALAGDSPVCVTQEIIHE